MFGRATVTFGIGPHSSKMCDKCKCVLKDHPSGAVHVLVSQVCWFIGSQVACWTHAGIHLRLADTSRRHACMICTGCLVMWQPRRTTDMSTNQQSQLLGAHKQVTYDGDLVLRVAWYWLKCLCVQTPCRPYWQQIMMVGWLQVNTSFQFQHNLGSTMPVRL